MNKLELKYRKLLRKIFGCVSFTAVAFVFQACYGVPDTYEVRLTGTVKSKTTNLPIKGIKIMINGGERYRMFEDFGMTNDEGKFDFYAKVPKRDYFDNVDSTRYPADSVRVRFLDIDGVENGHFEDKAMIINPAHKKEIKINVELEDK